MEQPGSSIVRLLVQTLATAQRPEGLQDYESWQLEAGGLTGRGTEPVDAAADALPGQDTSSSVTVLHEEDSHWLLVSDTFSPDVRR